MKLNFDSNFKNLVNKTLYWFPGDTEQSYNYNLINNRKKLEESGWVDKIIEYKFNSFGFRSEEFTTTDDNIMFLGCSLTFGTGIPIENTWAYITSKELNLKCYNLGIPGGSSDTCFRLCLGWIDKLKPKMVIFRRPPGIRMEFIINERIENINIGCTNESWSSIDWSWFLEGWASVEDNNELNYIKNYMAIKQICDNRNIPLVVPTINLNLKVDNARDLSHHGVETNKIFAETVLRLILKESYKHKKTI